VKESYEEELFKRNMVNTILCNIVCSAEYRGDQKLL